MCGIAGAQNEEIVNELIQHLSHRGSTTTVNNDRALALGHALHPVVGHVEQPLVGDGVLVANCEIYNWQALADEYDIDADNDAHLLLQLLDRFGTDVLPALDGVYAFAYLRDGTVTLARDTLGVKPLWYTTDPFTFASERQALERTELVPRELHPRHVVRYDMNTGQLIDEQRGFFDIAVDDEINLDAAATAVKERFLQAVATRVPDAETDVALLFSGGVDSTLVAAALQELDVDFTCYTAGIQHGNVDAPRDVDWAERVADDMGLDLVVNDVSLADVESVIPDVTNWISSSSVVKTGVALPFHFALQQADEPVVFSGLGSEQLYAGYSRQKEGYLNQECLSGLRSLYHRDLYRDDIIAMRNRIELRVPFLDHALVEHALTIPGAYKVQDGYRKYVLRKAAEQLGVPDEVAWRGKTAAQYGSNFDKAISRLAKDNGHDHKQSYLNTFRSEPDYTLAALFSGGKDSHAALYRMQRRNNAISCLINLQSANPDSYMFDAKQQDLVEQQGEQLGIPLLVQETAGAKEAELEDLRRAMERAKHEYGIDGVVAGALASTYQRDRVEQVAEQIGVHVFAPLWQEDPPRYMRWLVREGFDVMITETAARGLGDSWEGRVLDDTSVEELIDLAAEYRFNAAGEGGEYETVVVDGPLYSQPVEHAKR